MAQTTSAVNACDAVVSLDNGDGIPYDISGSSNEVSMDFNNDLGEYKTFGTRWRGRLECGSDAAIKLGIIYSQTDSEGFTILREWFFNERGSRTLTVDIPDSNVGGDRYTMEVFLEKMSVPATADEAGPIMVSCDLKPTGTVSVSVIDS